MGAAAARGHLVSGSPYHLVRIQLLVDAWDERGQVLAQRLTWVAGDLAAFGRLYFVVPAPRRAPRYRVRPFALDRLQGP